MQLILMYGATNSVSDTMRRFNDEYAGETHISYNATKSLVDKFLTTGSVADLPRAGRPKLSEAVEIAVLGIVAQNPQTSIRENSAQTNISPSTTHKVLKKHKFHPYKVSCHQELFFEDFNRRINFCELFTNRIAQDPNLLRHVCFSDEATFFS